MVVGVLKLLHLFLPTQKADQNMLVVCQLELLFPVGVQISKRKDVAVSSPFPLVNPLNSACPSTHRLATAHALVVGSTIIPELGRTARTSAETAGGAEDICVHGMR